jgi:pimeloyl-ACP methyl ester carboxylesterase
MLPLRRATTDQRLKLHDGRWLGYLDYGDPDGVPIICCHGAPGSRLSFFCDPNILLDMRIRLIVPDRPGLGLSTFQRWRRLLDWPGDVEQLADHLGLERFAMLGVSAGGPYALACAAAIPQRLTRVGLSSGAAPRELAPLRDFRPRERISNILIRYLPWPLLWAIYTPGLLLARRFPDVWLRSAYSRTIPADKAAGGGTAGATEWPASLPPAIREETLEPFQQGIRGHAWDVRLCGHRWGFRPGAISGMAVYLWHGEGDQLVPVTAARALAAAIPGCHATFYPGEGHDLGSHIREIFAALIAADASATSVGIPQV